MKQTNLQRLLEVPDYCAAFIFTFYGHRKTIEQTAGYDSSRLVLHVAGPMSDAIQGVRTPRVLRRNEAFTRNEYLYSVFNDKALPWNSVDGQDTSTLFRHRQGPFYSRKPNWGIKDCSFPQFIICFSLPLEGNAICTMNLVFELARWRMRDGLSSRESGI
jgi:hypothetical protein